jgi:hypothetical protein
MDLGVFDDKNRDGIADGPSTPLIKHISSPKVLQSRGNDHATNGIRMGIDSWIYIAVVILVSTMLSDGMEKN